MVSLIIGHRGAGKSSWICDLRAQDFHAFDLDLEIERQTGQSITDIFKSKGEVAFRQMEAQTLLQLCARNTNCVIALGAGFDGSHWPSTSFQVIWLRRQTDRDGRSFLDRPRLLPDLHPHDEYLQKFHERESRFKKWCHLVVVAPEGLTSYAHLTRLVFKKIPHKASATLTIKPWHLQLDLKRWLDDISHMSHLRFELRTDLLRLSELQFALRHLKDKPLLLSLRPKAELSSSEAVFSSAFIRTLKEESPQMLVDRDLGWTNLDWTTDILSTHTRHGLLLETLQGLESEVRHGQLLKLAVPVRDWSELLEGHTWWCKDPSRRAFFPLSETGRWQWYRLLFGPLMPLAFVNFDPHTNIADQPPLTLWLRRLEVNTPAQPEGLRFGAVLGEPIYHSWSPEFHYDFFKTKGKPFVAIPLQATEWNSAFPVLEQLGLVAAAITSPLKSCWNPSSATNTLIRTPTGVWKTANTDQDAMATWLKSLNRDHPVVVIGGGGTLASISHALSQLNIKFTHLSYRQASSEPSVLFNL